MQNVPTRRVYAFISPPNHVTLALIITKCYSLACFLVCFSFKEAFAVKRTMLLPDSHTPIHRITQSVAYLIRGV